MNTEYSFYRPVYYHGINLIQRKVVSRGCKYKHYYHGIDLIQRKVVSKGCKYKHYYNGIDLMQRKVVSRGSKYKHYYRGSWYLLDTEEGGQQRL